MRGPSEVRRILRRVLRVLTFGFLGNEVERRGFVVEPGEFELCIGSSSQDIRASGRFEVEGGESHDTPSHSIRRCGLVVQWGIVGPVAGDGSKFFDSGTARPTAVSYRRFRSFSIAFITIQSRSPSTWLFNFSGEIFRCLAMIVNLSPDVLSLVLGFSGSSSRISRCIST